MHAFCIDSLSHSAGWQVHAPDFMFELLQDDVRQGNIGPLLKPTTIVRPKSVAARRATCEWQECIDEVFLI